MTRSRKLLICLIFFLIGVAVGSFMSRELLFFVAFALVLSFLGCFLRWWLLPIFCLFLGIVRILVALPDFDSSHIANISNLERQISVEAIVSGEPENRNNSQYVRLSVQHPFRGKVLAKLRKYPELAYGDRLEVTGKFLKPRDFEGFSYSDYLAKDGIHAVIYNPRVKVLDISGPDGWSFLFFIKSFVQERIDQIFSEPSAGLAAGVLLGFRRSIPEEILNDFSISGLTHILAISGYNITLLITIFGLLLKGTSKGVRISVTIIVITCFAFLTGLSASVVRASIMGGITVFALFVGRRSIGINVLLLSIAIMVLVNPFILMSDISFQLSFTSTLGLLMLLPLWEVHLKKLPVLIAENLAVTMAAQIFTTPLILYYFGRFSLIAPFANVLFLPLIPAIMFLSFVAIVSSFIFLPLAFVWVSLTWLITEVLIRGVHLMALIPLASVEIGFFNELWLILYYLLLAIFIFRKPKSAPSY